MVLIHVGLLFWSVQLDLPGWELTGMLAPDNEVLIRAGGLHLRSLFEGWELWRVVSCAFLHGPWFHLLFNMLALRSIGRMGERLWGTTHHLVIFLVSSIGASLLSMAMVESSLMVGASGAVFGLGTALILELRRMIPIRPQFASTAKSLTRQIGFWLVAGVVASLGGDLPISAYGHLGGAVAGALIWGALREPKRRWLWVAGLIVYAGICVTGWGARWRPHQYQISMGVDSALNDDCTKAARLLEPWLDYDPKDSMVLNTWAYCETLRGGDLERALEVGRRALAISPGDPNVMDTVAWTLCSLGQVSEGQALLRKAVEVSGSEAVMVEHLEKCADVAANKDLGRQP